MRIMGIKVKIPGIRNIANNIDIIVGIIGIFVGILIISLYYIINLKQQYIGFAIFAASSIYLLLKNKFKKISFPLPKITPQNRLVLNIFFFSILSITFFIWYFQLYHRPLIYFILISFLTGVIAIEIFYFKKGDSVWPGLLKIFIISINIRAGLFYNFPSIMGSDAYGHMKIAELITDTGFIPPMEISEKYFYYPTLHIFLSIAQMIYRTDIKDAIFYSIGLSSILNTIFIYIIINKISGSKIALLSTLLINITNIMILDGIANFTPGSLIILYFIIIIYLYFQEEKRIIYKLLMLFLIFLMIITHQLSTFVVLISLILIYLGKYTFDYIYNKGITVKVFYLEVFAIGMLLYWMNTNVNIKGLSFFDYVVGPLLDVLRSGGEYGSNVLIVGYNYQRPLLEELILNLSYLILPFYAIGGILYWLSLKERYAFTIATATSVLYLLIYGIPLFGIRNLLTDRWQPFVSIFLSILASVYIVKIIELIKNNSFKIFTIFTIIFIMSFLMITTNAINKDNPIVAKETTVRNQFKLNEIYASRTISKMHMSDIKTIKIDDSFQNCFKFYGFNSTYLLLNKYDVFDIDYITSVAQDEKGTNIILRKSSLLEPITIKYSKLYGSLKAQILPKEFFERFMSKGYDKLYDNGNIMQYHKN